MLHDYIILSGFLGLMFYSVKTYFKVRGKGLSIEETIPAVSFGVSVFGSVQVLNDMDEYGAKNVSNIGLLWLAIIAGLLTCHYIRLHHVHRIKGRP